MNRHLKLAVILAPFLAIGGYIAADYYSTNAQEKQLLLPLTGQDECHLVNARCLLTNGDLQVNLSVSDSMLSLMSSHSLDQVLVSVNSKEPIVLIQGKNTLRWHSAEKINARGNKLRLFIRIEKARYIAEVEVIW
ncbi:MAG TPA: hypothetical protein EYH35_02365 [Thiotrichaceae bacterium]|nr:hypothetical protein [Thiotrichaceae bacterium]